MTNIEAVRNFDGKDNWALREVSIGPDNQAIGLYCVRLLYVNNYCKSEVEFNLKELCRNDIVELQMITNGWRVV